MVTLQYATGDTEEKACSSYSLLTLALDWWVVNAMVQLPYPQERVQYPIIKEAVWVPGAVFTGMKK